MLHMLWPTRITYDFSSPNFHHSGSYHVFPLKVGIWSVSGKTKDSLTPKCFQVRLSLMNCPAKSIKVHVPSSKVPYLSMNNASCSERHCEICSDKDLSWHNHNRVESIVVVWLLGNKAWDETLLPVQVSPCAAQLNYSCEVGMLKITL